MEWGDGERRQWCAAGGCELFGRVWQAGDEACRMCAGRCWCAEMDTSANGSGGFGQDGSWRAIWCPGVIRAGMAIVAWGIVASGDEPEAVRGGRRVVGGAWSRCVVRGVWCAACGRRCVAGGAWSRCVVRGVWSRCVVGGVWCAVCGGRRVVLGVWWAACGGRRVVGGAWCAACGRRRMVARCVVGGVWWAARGRGVWWRGELAHCGAVR